MGDKKLKEPTFYGRTGQELERLNYAVSDELIKQEREFNRMLNELEDEIKEEFYKDEQTGDKK